MLEPLACSDCFRDRGLRLEALRVGEELETSCPVCGSPTGKKLDAPRLEHIAHSFFVRGTIQRTAYGAAPRVQYNSRRETEIATPPWLTADLQLIGAKLGVGFFYYGPRLWMIGGVEPLEALQQPDSRSAIISRILAEYPTYTLGTGESVYRLRINPTHPADNAEYDSPPPGVGGGGRLDGPDLPILYASPDLQVCVHECRASAEDEMFVATLEPSKPLALLDLTEVLLEEDVTEFESLDLAVHMLFLAGPHSYDITRQIALAAREAGYDGLLYPSYFSLLRTGAIPLETSYGISHRRVTRLAEYEKAKLVPNIGIFGRPVEEGRLIVRCLNRVAIRRAEYDLSFGPVSVDDRPSFDLDSFTEDPA